MLDQSVCIYLSYTADNGHLWVDLAELADDMAVGTLEDLPRGFHLLGADGTLKTGQNFFDLEGLLLTPPLFFQHLQNLLVVRLPTKMVKPNPSVATFEKRPNRDPFFDKIETQ